MFKLIVSVLLMCNIITHAQENPIVTTVSGRIEGSILTSRLGKQIYSFRGIRYGQPPINDLRFQPPVPVEPWDGIYNATVNGPVCPQPGDVGLQSEDCLVVNVFSTKLPTANNNPKRPVIVHFHPGAFYSSGAAWGGPQYFMDQDIVLVMFNYRLMSLGFISTGDEFAPGNNGLKDQLLLLKWVKNHIAAFGGDPDNVTLQGYSAGTWSIITHMISPMSQGLFHKAALMSGGGPLGNWPLPREQLDIAKKQARIVGCPDDTSENIMKCLKTVPVAKLANSFLQFKEFGNDPMLIWSPVIDNELITENPISLIIKGNFQNIPIMVGQTTDEFGQLAFPVVDNKTLTDEMNKYFERVAPIAFIYERDTEQSRKVSRAVRRFYFENKPVDKSQRDNLSKLYSDSIIGFGVHRTAKLFAQYSRKPVYRYLFSYKNRYSNFYLPGTNNTIPWGVVHHDDLTYLFYIKIAGFPLFGKDEPQPDVTMVEKLTFLYANFARTGKPIPQPCDKLDNVEWEPFNLECQKYMDIGNNLVIKEKLYDDRFSEWEKLYPLSMYV